MQYDHIYDSAKWPYEAEVEIRPDKGTAAILFQQEGIVFRSDRNGNTSFATEDGAILRQETVDNAGRLFNVIYATIRKDEIVVRLPIIKWVDHYPHCDGEYDRWSMKIIAERYIVFPLPTKE